MTTTVTAKIQLRKGMAAQWTSANPTLLSGEVGFETDTLKLKIGDGTTAWTALAYHHDPDLAATYAALAHTHPGVYEPANANLQSHVSSTANPHSVTAAQVGADASGTAAGLIASHEAAANPHPGYLTPTEGDAAYATTGHNHSGVYDPAGTAASAVSAHAGGSSVHAIASVTSLQTALDGKSATSHDHAATYAPIAKGVTNGDSHDHAGGDGAQIAYSGLSGLPTLGTAAAQNTTAFEAAGAIATHAALTTTHGISSFGATLVDDADAATARSTLGLASGATTAAYAGAASEIHAATDKATPVDADELSLVDSAASWVLKKLTWANLKTTLGSVFAVLAGKSGGQTLIGGTGVSDALTLQGTSGNGTVTSNALVAKVGNNGALTAFSLLNSGQIVHQCDATADLPVYGAELLSSAGWTATSGWTESPDDVFAHTSGTTTLSHSATITSGVKYQISWTITGRTAGSITITVGGQSVTSTATGVFGPTATSTAAFTITPTTDFNGTVSLISLKSITAVSTPVWVGKSSAGTIQWEYRYGSALNNFFIGINAGGFNTTGTDNSAIGKNALYNNTTGTANSATGQNSLYNNTIGNYNTAIGYETLRSNSAGSYNSGFGSYALYSNTTGSNNIGAGSNTLRSNTTGLGHSAIGHEALYNNTTGNYLTAIGNSALRSNTTGNYNNVVGYLSLYNNTTGSGNNAFGREAGRFHADGVTALTDPEYSVYIGYGARGKDNADNNSVVIGGNLPIGLGANTTVIGTSSTTLTRLYGDIATGVDAPSAAIHAIKTTEQLRLGYDATNYSSWTVSSSGNLTIAPTGTTIYTPKIIENTTSGEGMILKSPDGTRYKITVANGGTLSISAA